MKQSLFGDGEIHRGWKIQSRRSRLSEKSGPPVRPRKHRTSRRRGDRVASSLRSVRIVSLSSVRKVGAAFSLLSAIYESRREDLGEFNSSFALLDASYPDSKAMMEDATHHIRDMLFE